LLNTAIERLSDHVTPEYHTQIGVIKDAGSAAVFCVLILGARCAHRVDRNCRYESRANEPEKANSDRNDLLLSAFADSAPLAVLTAGRLEGLNRKVKHGQERKERDCPRGPA
jgi:hypothetical protein